MIVRWALLALRPSFVRQLSYTNFDLVQLAKRDRSKAIMAQAVPSGSPRFRLNGGMEDVFSIARFSIAPVS